MKFEKFKAYRQKRKPKFFPTKTLTGSTGRVLDNLEMFGNTPGKPQTFFRDQRQKYAVGPSEKKQNGQEVSRFRNWNDPVPVGHGLYYYPSHGKVGVKGEF